jgi:signal transduction histidine kinase
VKFQNNGPSIPDPDRLFKAVTLSDTNTGLGLYVSHAIMRSYGGDLIYKPVAQGCCFGVKVPISPLWRDFARDENEEHEQVTHSAR